MASTSSPSPSPSPPSLGVGGSPPSVHRPMPRRTAPPPPLNLRALTGRSCTPPASSPPTPVSGTSSSSNSSNSSSSGGAPPSTPPTSPTVMRRSAFRAAVPGTPSGRPPPHGGVPLPVHFVLCDPQPSRQRSYSCTTPTQQCDGGGVKRMSEPANPASPNAPPSPIIELRERSSSCPFFQPLLESAPEQYNVLSELYHAERQYFADLDVLVSVFKRPLQRIHVLGAREMEQIFGNIEAIADLSGKMCTQLEKIVHDVEPVTLKCPPISHLFLDLKGAFSVYAPYCANHATSIRVLAQQQQQNASFNQFLITASQESRCHQLNLESYLIKPVCVSGSLCVGVHAQCRSNTFVNTHYS
eukprot:TRINITY_DN2962_c0_g3_i2.p1 TRINITY_DN2962_c0_g3~~TRINITY_DN2962_c0_g3_i2.p1  ORF type:complete len:356 (+),score=87.78 TRINITY_DN2962_c0_g3_i2:86-1153(+)